MAARKRRFSETNENSVQEVVDHPSVPLKGLAFGNEFSYIAKAAASRKAAERREERKRQQATRHVPLNDYDDGGDDDDMGGGFNFAGDDDGDDYDYGGDHDEGPVENNTGMASVDDAYRANVVDGGAFFLVCSVQSCCISLLTNPRFFVVPQKMPLERPKY